MWNKTGAMVKSIYSHHYWSYNPTNYQLLHVPMYRLDYNCIVYNRGNRRNSGHNGHIPVLWVKKVRKESYKEESCWIFDMFDFCYVFHLHPKSLMKNLKSTQVLTLSFISKLSLIGLFFECVFISVKYCTFRHFFL